MIFFCNILLFLKIKYETIPGSIFCRELLSQCANTFKWNGLLYLMISTYSFNGFHTSCTWGNLHWHSERKLWNKIMNGIYIIFILQLLHFLSLLTLLNESYVKWNNHQTSSLTLTFISITVFILSSGITLLKLWPGYIWSSECSFDCLVRGRKLRLWKRVQKSLTRTIREY